MIEINLIPQKLKKQKQVQFVFMAGAAGAGMIIAAMIAVLFLQYRQIAEIDSRIKRIDAESGSLKDKIDEVKQFRAKDDTFARKKGIVDKLLAVQAFWPELLDRVGSMLLPDMWLTELNQVSEKDTGVEIHIEGEAMTKVMIADFIKRLNESPYVADIKTASISDAPQSDKGMTFASFSINFTYKKTDGRAAVNSSAAAK
jgi:type IV pilus assembly protein PilN